MDRGWITESVELKLPHFGRQSIGIGSDYRTEEQRFDSLLRRVNLDEYVRHHPGFVQRFEARVESAIREVYNTPASSDRTSSADAHLFIQRILYYINRQKLFWYDELSNYQNERSHYLFGIRERVESAWQEWELTELNGPQLANDDVADALVSRCDEDLSPTASASGVYFRDHVGIAGYRRLIAIASLDGLVEASQLSRTLGGVSNDIHAVMTKLLVEEYGGGRLSRKHSSFFIAMLTELGMQTEAESYFDLVPWEVLATINHSFLLSERKRFYLRYVGGLLFTEISVPAAFHNYRAAAQRLGMSETARAYWDLHIREDERHGQWMLHDVALPLARRYPDDAWELVEGYDQQKFMSGRAGIATEQRAREAESCAVCHDSNGRFDHDA